LEHLAVAEPHAGTEAPVHRPGRHGQYPRRFVGQRGGQRATVAAGAHDEDALGHRRERADGDGVLVQRRGDAAEGHREDVDAVLHGGVHPGQQVGLEAPLGVADLVHGQVRAGCRPGSGATAAKAEGRDSFHEPAGRSAGGVRAVADVVGGGVVHDERRRADELVVAPNRRLAGALPPGRRRRHAVVAERRVLLVDPGVQKPNDGALAVAGGVPDAAVGSEPEEPRCARRHERHPAFRERAHEPWLPGHGRELVVGQPSGEAGEHAGVRVANAAAADTAAGALEERLVPPAVRGLVFFLGARRRRLDQDDVSSGVGVMLAGGAGAPPRCRGAVRDIGQHGARRGDQYKGVCKGRNREATHGLRARI